MLSSSGDPIELSQSALDLCICLYEMKGNSLK